MSSNDIFASSAITRSSAVTTSGLISSIAGVAIAERAIGAQDRRSPRGDLLDVEPEPEGEFARLKSLQADSRLDDHLHDRLRDGLGDLLDLHAAVAEAMTRTRSVLRSSTIAEIELALERLGDFDIDALNGLALGPGLSGDEPLAEQLFGRLADFVIGRAEFDAARLAARAGMDLRLDRPVPAAELRCDERGLFGL